MTFPWTGSYLGGATSCPFRISCWSITVLTASNLRIKIIAPLIAVATIASALVAISSWKYGKVRTQSELARRFSNIEQTVTDANFPLTQSVLNSLSELTDTEWLTLNEKGELILTTIQISPEQWRDSSEEIIHQIITSHGINQAVTDFATISMANRSWMVRNFVRQDDSLTEAPFSIVVVLFDHENVQAASRRAAVLPLLTGLSTIASITLLMLLISSRLISRIQDLQTQVEIISSGNFQTRLADDTDDELGRLAQSVNRMASQLNQLWTKIHQHQRAKLLHQVASGMAHQLRNTLMGAKMALELHSRSCPNANDEEVTVALNQLDIAENYVKRLSVVGSGQQHQSEPQNVLECLRNLESTHRSVAEHLKVSLTWQTEKIDRGCGVSNGSLFSAAISNLVLNAIQASQTIIVSGQSQTTDCLEIEVIDHGEGVPEVILEEVFEPFSTTKPEGMGLGLALVKQSAEQLGGKIEYDRRADCTIFRFRCLTQDIKPTATT